MHNYFVIIIITCTMYVHSTQYTIMLIIHLQRNKNVISGCNALAMHLSNEKRQREKAKYFFQKWIQKCSKVGRAIINRNNSIMH